MRNYKYYFTEVSDKCEINLYQLVNVKSGSGRINLQDTKEIK